MPYFELIPVLPPIDESTCASKVVGIFMNFIPLLKILAVKLETSPVIPPPIDIKQSFLWKLFFKSISNNLFAVFWLLLISLELKK